MLAFKTRLIFLRKSPEGISVFIRLCWATTDSEMKRSGIELSEVFSNSQLVRLQRTLEESMRSPYRRLLTSGVEIMLRKRGQSSHVGHVHPHKFRRTMATAAIDRGMPIEQVQTLLGHEKIDTTLMYAMVNQTNVKNAHKKFLG